MANDTTNKAAQEIVMLPIERLHPNINNPRQSVGDISELTDSIKARGILQPLTVVEGIGTWYKDWVVVLGHRRLEAAKAAGLAEIPCIISDMTLSEQVDAMIIENDRRSDLTKIERSNGYQLSFELHDDNVADTALAVGVSETTVRRYLKLQSIDEELRHTLSKREREGVQINMIDYDKLANFKDEDRKKRVAAELGTKNFEFTYNRELQAEKNEQCMAALFGRLEELRIEHLGTAIGYKYLAYINSIKMLDSVLGSRADELKDCKLYYTYITGSSYVHLYRSYSPTEIGDKSSGSTTVSSHAQPSENDLREAELSKLFGAAYASRYAFMKELSTVKASVVFKWFVKRMVIDETICELIDVAKLLDVSLSDEDFYKKTDILYELFEDLTYKNPMLVLAAAVYCSFYDDADENCIDHDGTFVENLTLVNLYAYLKELGYKMSDEEKQLMDGSHYLYKES